MIKKEVKSEIANYLTELKAKELCTPKINKNFVSGRSDQKSLSRTKNDDLIYKRDQVYCLYDDFKRRQDKI